MAGLVAAAADEAAASAVARGESPMRGGHPAVGVRRAERLPNNPPNGSVDRWGEENEATTRVRKLYWDPFTSDVLLCYLWGGFRSSPEPHGSCPIIGLSRKGARRVNLLQRIVMLIAQHSNV